MKMPGYRKRSYDNVEVRGHRVAIETITALGLPLRMIGKLFGQHMITFRGEVLLVRLMRFPRCMPLGSMTTLISIAARRASISEVRSGQLAPVVAAGRGRRYSGRHNAGRKLQDLYRSPFTSLYAPRSNVS